MAPTCVVCGRVSQPKHRPIQVKGAFNGMGYNGLRAALQGTGFKFADPSGTVICRTSQRSCYPDTRTLLLAVDAYKKEGRQPTVGELSALRAIAGATRDGSQVDGDVRETRSGKRPQQEAQLEATVAAPLARPVRICGTPGCEQPDGHDGPCASMLPAPGPRRTRRPRAATIGGAGRARVAVEEGCEAAERTIEPIDPSTLPEAPPP